MNGYLKEIGDLCDIPKEISFHMSRHHLQRRQHLQMVFGHANLTITES
jgi:hypothetical protein